MIVFWKSFKVMSITLLNRPMWLLLVVILCLMSLVYANRTIRDLPIAVVDLDHSVTSRYLVRQANANSKIMGIAYNDLGKAIRDIHTRKLFAVVIIPYEFEKKLLRDENVTIPVYGDSTNRLANGLLQQDMTAAYETLLLHYHHDTLAKQGLSESEIHYLLRPVHSETSMLFNPGLNFAAITLPGVLVMLYQQSLLITSANMIIFLHKRYGGRVPPPVLWGSITALLPIWLFLSMIFFILWPGVLGYKQMASIPEILFVMFPFLYAIIGLSKLIVERLRKIEMVYLTLSFLTTPVYYLEGTIWSPNSMPAWIRFISYFLLSTWAVEIITGINQIGTQFG